MAHVLVACASYSLEGWLPWCLVPWCLVHLALAHWSVTPRQQIGQFRAGSGLAQQWIGQFRAGSGLAGHDELHASEKMKVVCTCNYGSNHVTIQLHIKYCHIWIYSLIWKYDITTTS